MFIEWSKMSLTWDSCRCEASAGQIGVVYGAYIRVLSSFFDLIYDFACCGFGWIMSKSQ